MMPVGRDWYAVSMRRVREVVSQPIATPLPSTPPSVLGLINLRGEVVPFFDTAALLGLRATGAHPFCVVVLTAAGPAGLAVTGLPETVDLDESVAGADSGLGISRHTVGSRLATLVDVDTLLANRPASAHGATA
jgi:purine-binding chemotaxis protein CheW